VNEGDVPADPLEKEGEFSFPKPHRPHPTRPISLTSLCVIVRALSELLAQVKDEQQYIVMRERTHRNTAESTNSRVKWWNMFVIGIVIGESLFQVWWLRRFFEVKRVV
jgi:hypothetical protein